MQLPLFVFWRALVAVAEEMLLTQKAYEATALKKQALGRALGRVLQRKKQQRVPAMPQAMVQVLEVRAMGKEHEARAMQLLEEEMEMQMEHEARKEARKSLEQKTVMALVMEELLVLEPVPERP